MTVSAFALYLLVALRHRNGITVTSNHNARMALRPMSTATFYRVRKELIEYGVLINQPMVCELTIQAVNEAALLAGDVVNV